MLDLYKLKHFVAVTRTGSFIEAADELRISQPALSRSIQSLERQFGVQLLVRSRLGVRLTDAGAQLLGPIEDLLNNADRITHMADEVTSGFRGQIAIGVGPTIATAALSIVSREIVAQRKPLTVRFALGSSSLLSGLLLNSEIDLLIGTTIPSAASDRIESNYLATVRPIFVVRGGHPLAGRRKVALKDLEPFAMVASTAWAASLTYADAEVSKSLFPVSVQLDNFELLVKTVKSSDAILSATSLIMDDELLEGLKVLPISSDLPSARVGIHRLHSRPLTAAAQYVIDLIRRSIDSRLDRTPEPLS